MNEEDYENLKDFGKITLGIFLGVLISIIVIGIISAYPVTLQNCTLNNTLFFNTTSNNLTGNVILECVNYIININDSNATCINCTNIYNNYTIFNITNITCVNCSGNYSIFNHTYNQTIIYNYSVNNLAGYYTNGEIDAKFNSINLTSYQNVTSNGDWRGVDTIFLLGILIAIGMSGFVIFIMMRSDARGGG